MNNNYSTKRLIEGIKNRESNVLEHIYEEFFPMIEGMVVNNSGDSETAWDVFQEGIMVMYTKLRDNELEIESSFKTYFYSVCYRLWLKQLNQRLDFPIERLSNPDEHTDLFDDYDETLDKVLKNNFLMKHFEKLPKDCKQILQLFFDKVSHKRISQIMGFTGDAYVRKRKHFCKETLIESLKSDPDFDDMMAKETY